MVHTLKTFQAIYIYFTKIEESSRWVLYSSIICLNNHPNMWGFIFTYAIQDTQIQSQLDEVVNKLLCKPKIQNQEVESKLK